MRASIETGLLASATYLVFPITRIIEAFTALLTVLVGGPLAFGLVMVNSVWDPAEWLFLVSSIALV